MVKAAWNGVTIAESDDTVVVEGNHYFPESSVRREYLTFSNHRTSCPWKGQARYHSLLVNGELNPDAVWYYPEPTDAAAEIRGRANAREDAAGPGAVGAREPGGVVVRPVCSAGERGEEHGKDADQADDHQQASHSVIQNEPPADAHRRVDYSVHRRIKKAESAKVLL